MMAQSLQRVVIGGGTGFVGNHLCNLLRNIGYPVTVISRMPGIGRMTWNDLQSKGLPDNTDTVINLAGQNILDMKQRWTVGFKQNVYNSRINTTTSLANAILTSKNQQPSVFITISGVGIYKPNTHKEYNEDTVCECDDFFTQLCHDWENAGKIVVSKQCRHVIIRSGVVLGRQGGMIQQLYLPFYLGLGGPVASGEQYLPWIHIDDLTGLIRFAIENRNVEGVLNGVAPETITNKQFADAFAQAMNRPAFFPVPESLLNFLLSKERADMLTKGQKVLPQRVLSYGYKYKHPDIKSACENLVGQE